MYATSSGPYYAQSLSGSPDIEMIKNRGPLVHPVRMLLCANKYRPAFDKWNELVDKLNHEKKKYKIAVCVFAATILATAINENS